MNLTLLPPDPDEDIPEDITVSGLGELDYDDGLYAVKIRKDHSAEAFRKLRQERQTDFIGWECLVSDDDGSVELSGYVDTVRNATYVWRVAILADGLYTPE